MSIFPSFKIIEKLRYLLAQNGKLAYIKKQKTETIVRYVYENVHSCE